MKSKTTKIMGVLNITPNSFSDGGKYFSKDSALEQFNIMIESGVDIIDIGAESTGPNSKPVSFEEEISRLSMIFDSIELKSKLVSVDTYKAKTAEWALDRGAKIINDVSGLRADPELVDVVSSFGAKIVIMYAQVTERFPHASFCEKEYENLYGAISDFFKERIDFCLSKGIKKENIILDPGMGSFISANSKYSWQLIRLASSFIRDFDDFEILYGISRKAFIKTFVKDGTVGRDSIDYVSKFIEIELIRQGVHIIRTHNVSMLKMFKALDEMICCG